MKHERVSSRSISLDSQRPLVETDDRQDSHLLEHLVEDEARQHERGQQQLLLVSTMPNIYWLLPLHCALLTRYPPGQLEGARVPDAPHEVRQPYLPVSLCRVE